MLKPYYKLNVPFPKEKFLADTFTLPNTIYDNDNPYLPPECDALGMPLTCDKHNVWIHRFYDGVKGANVIPVRDILSEDLIHFFESRGHNIGCIFIFHARPGMADGAIHADWGPIENGPRNNWAFNWTIGAKEDHYMIWYEPKSLELNSDGWPITANYAPISYPIPTWYRNKVNEIDRHNITGPTLVRTDIPHNAINRSTESRWCFSIRANPSNNWEQAVEWFNDIIVE